MNVSWVSGVNVSISILPIFIMILLRERNISALINMKESKRQCRKNSLNEERM